MSANGNSFMPGLTSAIGAGVMICAAKAIIDLMFVHTLVDNDNAWQARQSTLDKEKATETYRKIDQKRQRAREWINMTTMERLVRLPPFDCLKR